LSQIVAAGVLRVLNTVWTRLAGAGGGAEPGWGHADHPLEDAGELALIAEPGGEGDLDQRDVRFGDLAAGVGDAQLAHVVAHGAAEMLPECAGQVDRMDPDLARDRLQG
jgi:hypothetical protein